MKVLQINIVCGVGSTGRIAQGIAEESEKNGIINYIAYGYGKSNIKNSIKIGTKFEYYVHNILSRLFGMQGRFSYFATKRFLKRIDDINPDIIHLHNIHGNYINYKLLFEYIKKKDKPVIWTFHDCWPFTGKCVHFDYKKCYKWKKQCCNCPQLKEYPKSLIDNSKNEYLEKKKTFTSIDCTIVTPSEWLAKLVKQSFFKNKEILVINNGIDLKLFKPSNSLEFRKKYNLEDAYVILGVAGDWGDRKGIDTFIDLNNLIDKKKYKIVLVGLTQNQINELPDDIIKINKTNNVKELAQIYSEADVFVNPTKEDNFPTTNLEALACGTPVITFNTGGSIESIDSDCGLIVNSNTTNELLEKICEIEKLNIAKNECIEKSKNYDKIKKFKKYVEIYKSIYKRKEIR